MMLASEGRNYPAQPFRREKPATCRSVPRLNRQRRRLASRRCSTPPPLSVGTARPVGSQDAPPEVGRAISTDSLSPQPKCLRQSAYSTCQHRCFPCGLHEIRRHGYTPQVALRALSPLARNPARFAHDLHRQRCCSLVLVWLAFVPLDAYRAYRAQQVSDACDFSGSYSLRKGLGPIQLPSVRSKQPMPEQSMSIPQLPHRSPEMAEAFPECQFPHSSNGKIPAQKLCRSSIVLCTTSLSIPKASHAASVILKP